MRKWDPYERRQSADEDARDRDRVSADVEASRRRERNHAAAIARGHQKAVREQIKAMARAQAAVVRAEAFGNPHQIRKAKRNLRKMKRGQ